MTVLWQVRSSLASILGTATGLPTFDGPLAAGDVPTSFLLIGSDGGETGTGEGTSEGATTRLTLSDAGVDWYDDNGEVVCALWSWTGDGDLAAPRMVVRTAFSQVLAALRADPHLSGLLTPQHCRADVTSVAAVEAQTSAGAVTRVTFTVAYNALLT